MSLDRKGRALNIWHQLTDTLSQFQFSFCIIYRFGWSCWCSDKRLLPHFPFCFELIATSLWIISHFCWLSYVIVFLSSHICVTHLARNVSQSISRGFFSFRSFFFLILNLTSVYETHTCLSIIIPSCVKLSASCSLGNLLTFALGFCSHLLALKYLNIQIPTLHLRHEQISGARIS